MSGICGIIDHGKGVNRDVLVRIRDALHHRRPDEAGIYLSPDREAGFGYQGLDIMDLSSRDNRPMANKDENLWVTFNGKIYNFMEQREALEEKGHRFRSRSDTEVIVHLYEEFGEDFPCFLEGQFAIVLWDCNRNLLLLARDRAGKKSLYYREDGRRFLFASEIKPLLADPSVSRELDPVALSDYLTFQYVPDPRTLFKKTRKLPPGHILRFQDGRIRTRPYWTLVPESTGPPREDEYYEEELIHLMLESVRKRLTRDEPLGVFLSGGLDSSTIVAMMSALNGGKIKTFSVGFKEEDSNEFPFVDKVAKTFDTDHQRILFQPLSAEELIPKIAARFDEPVADPAAVPTYLMFEAASQEVAICLCSEGGDEIFGGTPRYDVALNHQGLMEQLLVGRNDLKGPLTDALQPALNGYVQSLCSFNAQEKETLLTPEVHVEVERERKGAGYPPMDVHYERYPDLDYLSKLQYLEMQTYLPGNLLARMDRSSMLASLEVRAPMLDHRLMTFALGLPQHLKVRSGIKKFILRKVMQESLPSQVLWRPGKGASVPLAGWNQRDLKAYANEVLLSGKLEHFRKGVLARMMNSGWLESPECSLKVWTLLIFETWRRSYSP